MMRVISNLNIYLKGRFPLTHTLFCLGELSLPASQGSRPDHTSPAFIVIKAASEFKDKTTAINQMWQTDFTYLKIIGWGWMYLSTILDDFSRYVEESHIAGALLFTG